MLSSLFAVSADLTTPAMRNPCRLQASRKSTSRSTPNDKLLNTGVVLDFRGGRGRDGPKRFLGQFEGLLQADGYAAYDKVGGAGIVHAACWAHVERSFTEILQLNPGDAVATPIMRQIDELFAIDGDARQQGLSLESRHALRQERAKPLLDSIRQQVETAGCGALPASQWAKPAITRSPVGRS